MGLEYGVGVGVGVTKRGNILLKYKEKKINVTENIFNISKSYIYYIKLKMIIFGEDFIQKYPLFKKISRISTFRDKKTPL